MDRRHFLKLAAFAPALPPFLVRSAQALDANDRYGGNVLVVARMMGGNDGLNTVVPFRDDLYYKGRPNIAIPRDKLLPLAGGDLGLHPAMTDWRWLIDEGFGAIVQNTGYPNPSRSHSRATEIWETGSISVKAPEQGWLGRYLDRLPSGEHLEGVQFGAELGRTLQSASRRSRSLSRPETLAAQNLKSAKVGRGAKRAIDRVRLVQNELAETGGMLRRAEKASGSRFAYPDTQFGNALRWTANLIETGCPTRLFYVTLGSFDSGFSFDTHLDQLAAHQALYTEFGAGLRAFAEQLRAAKAISRVQLLTFSDFGRQVGENNTHGTDHGDASVLFALGGKLRAGLHGSPPDIAGAYDGGLRAQVDFRAIYADVLQNWLNVKPETILGQTIAPYSLIA